MWRSIKGKSYISTDIPANSYIEKQLRFISDASKTTAGSNYLKRKEVKHGELQFNRSFTRRSHSFNDDKGKIYHRFLFVQKSLKKRRENVDELTEPDRNQDIKLYS